MEPIVPPILVAVSWLGSFVGLTFSVSLIAALVVAAYYAGSYYAVSRWIVKALEQAAMRRIP